jgi:hypothetical protein
MARPVVCALAGAGGRRSQPGSGVAHRSGVRGFVVGGTRSVQDDGCDAAVRAVAARGLAFSRDESAPLCRTRREAGIWFISLDAARRSAVITARVLAHLPYFLLEDECAAEGESVVYSSVRTGSAVAFEGTYAPRDRSAKPSPVRWSISLPSAIASTRRIHAAGGFVSTSTTGRGRFSPPRPRSHESRRTAAGHHPSGHRAAPSLQPAARRHRLGIRADLIHALIV